MTTELKNLAAKMIKIMNEVGYIKKTGFNQFHRYKYATEADVVSAFSDAMRENNVFMFSSILERECQQYKTRGDKNSFLITVKLQVTFVDADSGESYSGIFFGDGSDADDKGVYKAMTGAQKYALMKTFLAETGDDPERDHAKSKEPIDKKALIETLTAKSKEGTKAFRSAWSALSREKRSAVSPGNLDTFKAFAEESDKNLTSEDIKQ